MSEAFDPYHRWLGIQPKDQPPNHYRLLGIDLFEDDPEVIQDAAERQMAHVRKYQLGPNSAISQKILNELATAKTCLLNRDKKVAYDATIKAKSHASNSSTEILSNLPAPSSSPPIENEYRYFTIGRYGPMKTSDFIKKLGSSWYKQAMLPYIGLGVVIIVGLIFTALFMMRASFNASPTVIAKKENTQPINSTEQKSSQKTGSEAESNSTPSEDQGMVSHSPAESEQKLDISESINDSESIPKTPSSASPKLPPDPDSPPPSDNNQTIKRPDVPDESKHDDGYSSPVPEDKIIMSLPSGKTFDSRDFDVDLDSVKNRLKDKVDKLKNVKNSGENVVILQLPKENAYAWSEINKGNGKLDGVILTFNQADIPIIYAEYTNDKLKGIVKKWNENGQREYWCQYKNDLRDGFCCYFKEDILVMLFEINRYKINAVHLCSNSKRNKSFASDAEASENDKNAKILIDEINKIESNLKKIGKEYVSQITRWRNKRIGEQHEIQRNEMLEKIRLREIQRQQERDALRRKGGGL